MKKFLLFALSFMLATAVVFAQDKTISGKITAADDGSGLPGVNVVLKGTTTGAVTDVDGNYRIVVPGDGGVLVFSFIGFQTQEVTIGNQSVIDVSMSAEVTQLSEIVVTALGIERDEASLGYAVSQVSGDEVTKSGNSNVIDALNGKVAGVQISNSGGEPGAGTSMIIRGYTSINYSNQPLYIVDGIPINNDTQFGGTIGGTSSANRAVDINPDEIESVSILKGGAATALYGIRAANGAVIITTKKGKSGKKGLNVEYSFRGSSDQVNKLHETTDNFARGRFGGYSNVTHWQWGEPYQNNPVFPAGTITDLDGDGTTEDVSGQPIPAYPGNYERFWQDGSTFRHNLAVSGSGGAGSFYASVSDLDQTGTVPNNTFYKQSFLINADVKVSDKITYSGKANYIRTGGKRFRSSTGVLEGLGYWHTMWDVNGYPWKDANGDKTWFSGGVPHPQWIVNEEGEDWNLDRWIARMGVNWEIHPWFNVNYNIGMDQYSEKRKEVRPIGSVNTASNQGDMMELRLTNYDFTSDLILRGNGQLNSDLDFSYLAGLNVFRQQYDRLRSNGTTFVLRNLYTLSNTQTVTSDTYDFGRMLVGAYVDLTFGYKQMLYLQLTGRNDWSSTLPEDNNSFFYPSASLTFLLSEVWQPSWLSLWKFRGSFAQIANDAPVQALRDTYAPVTPSIFGRSRFTVNNGRNNPNLKPEQTTEIELGMDVRVLNGLLGLDFAWYDRTSTDQIIRQPVSTTTGYSTLLVNLGEINTTGTEWVLSINDPIKVAGFHWTTSLNFTRNISTVNRIGESTDDDLDRVIISSGWWTSAQMVAVEGQRYGTIYGDPYQRYGNLTVDDPGYLDQPLLIGANGLPLLESSPTILGNVNPDWILGITSTLDYKGIKFGFTLDRRQGGDIVNGLEANFVYSGLSKTTDARFYPGAPPGADATKVFEGVQSDGSPNTVAGQLDNGFYSNVWRRVEENTVEDGSWWRLRNIFVGYAFPQSLLENTFLTMAEITLSGRNVWLKTDYTGNDPEISAHGAGNTMGFDELAFPNTKSYEIGLRIGF